MIETVKLHMYVCISSTFNNKGTVNRHNKEVLQTYC